MSDYNRYAVARRKLKQAIGGVWLVDEKKGYTLLDGHQEVLFSYSDNLTLNAQKVEFERGELLKKIVSLNPKAIEPVVSYMRTEFALHRDAMPDMREISDSIEEQEATNIFYMLDRLDELHYRLYHGLLNNELFDELSLNEVDLLVDLLIAEYSHVYSVDYSQLDNADDYIPELFWNHDLQEEIKGFLCSPSEPLSDKLSDMLMSGVVVHKVSIDGVASDVVNVKSFSELIALEIGNIIARSSDFRKFVIWSVKSILNTKSINDNERYSSNKVQKRLNS